MAYIGIKAFPEHVYLVVGNNCAGVNFCRRYIVLDGCFIATPFRPWCFNKNDFFSTKVCDSDLGLYFGSEAAAPIMHSFCKHISK